MIIRDCYGKLCVISRKTCKNDISYNEKLYYLRLDYGKKYKNSIVLIPKSNILQSKNIEIKLD
jgi:hypothetical protein